MADIRTRIITNARPHLLPGEMPLVAFTSQTKPWWWLSGPLLAFLLLSMVNVPGALIAVPFMLPGSVMFAVLNRFRPVVVTDRRIIVFDSGRWATTKANSVVREAPRNIAMGPASGLWYTMTALGEPLQVHKRFHKDIAAADAAIGTRTGPSVG